MESFLALKEYVTFLEQKLAVLEGEVQSKQYRINQLKQEQNLFPAIGELVENKVEDEEKEQENNTGLRTTAMGVTEIQSLCMHCHELGTTSMLLTSIPFFREVVVMSFACPHCHYRDSQIQSGGAVQDKGQKITLKITKSSDLSRQIIKSDQCSIRIEELDFEIPPYRGVITNLEGLITEAIETLTETQPARLLRDGQEAVDSIEVFLQRLNTVLVGESFPLTISLDDPSGNSFIDNPFAPYPDPSLHETLYIRTPEQQEGLGLKLESIQEEGEEEEEEDSQISTKKPNYKTGSLFQSKMPHSLANQEIIQIPSFCPNCQTEGTADNCIVNLPFFKEVIVMAFNCDHCGFKDTEIKAGGAITQKGRRDVLQVKDHKVDLSRDVIKSDTSGVLIPELELELTRGSLGGLYTTVEGLMTKMKEDLFKNNFYRGDSLDVVRKARFEKLEKGFEDCLSGKTDFTLILQDPLANSYVYSPYDPPSSDPRLVVEEYERSWEEDEELGLHDMNVGQVEFVEADDANLAGETFGHLQKNKRDTHPNDYSKGVED